LQIVKLEIGSSTKIDSSWHLLDIVKYPDVDIVADISNPLNMINNDVYELIFASHVLEHIAWHKTVETLKELYRILKENGTIEIWVPNFDIIMNLYNQGKTDGWHKFNPDGDLFTWLNSRIFTYEPDFHKAIFDDKHLEKCLLMAGFKDIKKLDKQRKYDHGIINLGMSGTK